MTSQGIQMVKSMWGALAKRLGELIRTAPDPLVRHMWAGLEESIPQICDAALASEVRREGSLGIASLADLATWLDTHPNDPFILIPRRLAQAMTQETTGNRDMAGTILED